MTEYEKARDKLVHDAATAIELFGEDELERYAAEQAKKPSCPDCDCADPLAMPWHLTGCECACHEHKDLSA